VQTPISPAAASPAAAPRIVVLYAHPYPARSHANRALAEAIADLPGVDLRPLFDLYPDFSIDVAAEQRAVAAADLIVWQHPMYWYGMPSMLKLWLDQVLAFGWAYGEDGTALHGKDCLWVTTTGGTQAGYSPAGEHGFPFETFVPAVRQTARYCGMRWLEPLIVHRPAADADRSLADAAQSYRERLQAYLAATAADPRES
jgi:glutathione-regulated potassium-efflux system ancillary protein KefF